MRYIACALALGAALFSSSANSQTFTTLVAFTGTGGTANGWSPYGSLTVGGTNLYGMTSAGGILNGSSGFGNIFSIGTDGTNYQNLVSFTGAGGTASGNAPHGSLTMSGTTLYGMTQNGGANFFGNVFSLGTDGTNYRNLVSFTGTGGTATGYLPLGSLVLGGTALYGMTQYGAGAGNIFSIGTGGGSYQNLVSFTNSLSGTATGYLPLGSLVLGGTALYGMTQYGAGAGNIFSIGTGGGSYQNLVSFTNSLSGTATGYDPLGSLILGGSTLYGMTSFSFGNVFGVGANGTNYQHLIPDFTGAGGTASGEAPQGSLTLGGTTLYGMTENGGTFGDGNIFSVGVNGTNYKNLVSFSGNGGTASGSDPYGSLIISGTTLYGMTSSGGTGGYGAIFSAGIDGSDFDDLYSFTGGADGGDPHGDLTLSSGTLFGMTSAYGANGDGTVFALTLPTPEPGTLALVAGGAAVLVTYRCRRWRMREGRRPAMRAPKGRRFTQRRATPW